VHKYSEKMIKGKNIDIGGEIWQSKGIN
jgi:hypothetical protein